MRIHHEMTKESKEVLKVESRMVVTEVMTVVMALKFL